MQLETNIAKVVEEVSDKAKYDAEVKKVLSDPQILSWIFEYTVREFNNCSITEIMAQKVTYDIRFKAALPEIGSVGMIINVEAQNKFYESYDLVSRGVFYCARMLSTQVRNEEASTEYNGLKKVYSIWICMTVPVNSEYTITGYHMNREDIYGHMMSSANQRYDLMELVMVCLGKPENVESGTELHKLLAMVLSDTLTPEEFQELYHVYLECQGE